MGRISRQVMFMEMCRAASRRSTCFRLNVGALVVADNNPVALGYNGHEPGAAHCAGNNCPGVIPGKCGTRHAEINALEKASAVLDMWPPREVDLYCTDSPCGDCVGFIKGFYQLKVNRIFYETPYRDTSALGRLHGITEVYLVTPAGYIVDHFTRQVVELP